mmetsp:Transcript_3214/g.7562  ORF Transcript_3214/g.7562 Transcript_3214/m.7562 type:complete len:271 (-) Transcript_3214:263-1075(-)
MDVILTVRVRIPSRDRRTSSSMASFFLYRVVISLGVLFPCDKLGGCDEQLLHFGFLLPQNLSNLVGVRVVVWLLKCLLFLVVQGFQRDLCLLLHVLQRLPQLSFGGLVSLFFLLQLHQVNFRRGLVQFVAVLLFLLLGLRPPPPSLLREVEEVVPLKYERVKPVGALLLEACSLFLQRLREAIDLLFVVSTHCNLLVVDQLPVFLESVVLCPQPHHLLLERLARCLLHLPLTPNKRLFDRNLVQLVPHGLELDVCIVLELFCLKFVAEAL